MGREVVITLNVPDDLARFRLPKSVNRHLHELLDRQDRGEKLSKEERQEAEWMVELAELLSLLRMRAQRSAC